ncbi:uncharacterized protein LDX57_012885 [Aspergillus melleus]|uniref:uncharacterized protein n=1 Tax=Aspergillus melleus TaxID=138277 RepID=UPI001E8EEC22|nr:uncharacterized protein LDX57_012885 [Aspergillus melleus]KAH8435254.1 hypothetical protein LDX57_012885 [Aspergillus melleus]
MPLFRKKPKSPPTNSPAFRSVEHLPQLTDRRGSSVSTAIPAAVAAHPHPHPPSHPQPQPPPVPAPPPPYHHPAHSPSQSSLHRSQSQRHSRSDPAVGIPASPSAPQQRFEVDPSDDDHDEPEHHSRRTIRNIFSLHSSNTPRDSTGPLERHRSLRRSSPAAARRNRPLSVDTTSPDNRPPLTSRSREYVVESLRTTPQSPMPPQDFIPSSQNNSRLPRSPHIPSIQRSNTDSSLVVEPLPPPTTIHQPSPIDPSRKPPPELIPGPPQHQQPQPSLDPSSARPSSRQSLGPPSPLRPLPNHPPDAPQQGMSERPSTGPAPAPPASSAFGQCSSDTGLRNNTAAHGSSEPGRSTPTSNHSRSRDEADLDMRTLVQKHDELRTFSVGSRSVSFGPAQLTRISLFAFLQRPSIPK